MTLRQRLPAKDTETMTTLLQAVVNGTRHNGALHVAIRDRNLSAMISEAKKISGDKSPEQDVIWLAGAVMDIMKETAEESKASIGTVPPAVEVALRVMDNSELAVARTSSVYVAACDTVEMYLMPLVKTTTDTIKATNIGLAT